MPNIWVKGWERMLGFATSIPTELSSPSKVDPTRVKPKLTRNWIVNRLSLPNINVETREDKTNIHAKPQTKTTTGEFEFTVDARSGAEAAKDDAIVVRAVWVKIW